MKVLLQIATLAASLAVATGCTQTKPLISHAHIGHALTTWHDTPDEEGLFTAASKELDIAIDASELAFKAGGDAARTRRHLDDTLNALNPDRQPIGPGRGYGAIRALRGAIEHLEYAANSDDASENFVGSIVTLADHGDLTISRMLEAQRLIVELRSANPANDPRLYQVRRLLLAAKYGAGQDGTIANSAEWGLSQIAVELDNMLEREVDPDYQPVPRKYVLGLVRLPNGIWGFRRVKRDHNRRSYGY